MDRFNKKLQEGRRVGNSTRIIDELVQQFFNNGFCIVTDHYYNPDNDRPTRNNLRTLINRLLNEHEVSRDFFTYDSQTRKLTLKKEYYDRYK
jgi:hypothetical protein